MESEVINEAVRAGAESADIEKRIETLEKSDIEGGIPILLLNRDQSLRIPSEAIDMYDERQPAPRRRGGSAEHTELASFIGHVNRYKQPDSTVWATVEKMRFTCIFNDDPAGENPAKAGWADHTSHYGCPLSPEWRHWVHRNGYNFSQDEFAQWIEDHSEDIRSGDKFPGYPTAIELLEMARDLRVHTKGQFERKVDPTTGQYTMVCKDEHTASSTKIPPAFMLGLRVFDGASDAWPIEARVRFTMSDGRPKFRYELHRAEETKRKAFSELRDEVMEKTGLPVFAGSK